MKKNIFFKQMVLVIVILIPTLCYCVPSAPIDTRSAGMGGTFVGIAEGRQAQFHNPAGLYGQKAFRFGLLDVGFGGELAPGFDNIFEHLTDFTSGYTIMQEASESGGSPDLPTIHAFAVCLKTLMDIEAEPGKGMAFSIPGAVAQVQLGPAVISPITLNTHGGFDIIVDLASLSLAEVEGSTTTLGIDFTMITDTYTPRIALLEARDSMTDFVQVLIDGGANPGSWSNEQIAKLQFLLRH